MTHPAQPLTLSEEEPDASGWRAPGTMALRLVAVAVMAVALSGGLSSWLVSQASEQEAVRQLMGQQTDEVEVLARLLASKIEQTQKLLRTVAAGMTPDMLASPSSLNRLLQQGLAAGQFFDAIQVALPDGELRLNLRAGRPVSAANLAPAEREALRRTLIEGKPMVSEVIAGRTSAARVMFTMPLHGEDGRLLGVLAGTLPLQSQGLLPPSMVLPAREGSRLLVFNRDGSILFHSDPSRTLGQVRDEVGLAPVYARWLQQAQPVVSQGSTQVQDARVVSMAGMPLPQWIVARVSAVPTLLAPLTGMQREAWWGAVGTVTLGMALVAVLLIWVAQPLVRLCQSARQLLRQHTSRAARLASPAIVWPRSGGEVGALVEVFQGLAQQSAQQHLQQTRQESQLQAILDSASLGIVITHHETLEVLGRQVCQMLGYAVGELQGRSARTIHASDADYASWRARVQAEFSAHGGFDGDVCFRRKDGSPVWARVQARPVRPGEANADTLWLLEDITATREAQHQQAWEATHDVLTQLCNRAAFEQRLGLLLAERSAQARVLAAGGADAVDNPSVEGGDGVVLFLDIDYFTLVNEVAGHDAGDDVLRHVARLLETQVRQVGWAARLGGDKFAVVLPGCPLARGQAVAEQLRAAVQDWEPAYQGRGFTLSVSIGLVALAAGLHDLPAVLHAADMACYDAKRSGRNRVTTGKAGEDGVISGRMSLEG